MTIDRQIRRLGVVLLGLFVALFLQLTYLQMVRADKLNKDPRNTRTVTRDFSRDRGVIQTADNVVVAKSVAVNDEFKRLRQYPEGPLFASVTGYFSFTFGATGVERTYAPELSGRAFDVRLRNPQDLLRTRQRTANVTLTLTKRLQQVAKDALGNRKGSVVALDPRNGDVLALWSFPSYDPSVLSVHSQAAVRDAWNRLQTDPSKPLLPRAYSERYAPGSTFKVVTAAAALERKPELITKDYPRLKQFPLPQSKRTLPNFGGGTCGGTLPQLLKVSCNTGFAQMGIDLAPSALVGEANDFGFNQRPPLDLTTVRSSVFPGEDAFDRNNAALAISAIGQQDVAATPLQMALVAAAIGNGGKAPKPHVMKEIRDSEGERVRGADTGTWVEAMSPANAGALRDMMIGVVNGGTATRAAVPGVQVAAKTGTAQTTGDNAHAWLIGFAPAEAPTIAIAVIVESQPGVSEATGGRVAAPIAKTVMQAALSSGSNP